MSKERNKNHPMGLDIQIHQCIYLESTNFRVTRIYSEFPRETPNPEKILLVFFFSSKGGR